MCIPQIPVSSDRPRGEVWISVQGPPLGGILIEGEGRRLNHGSARARVDGWYATLRWIRGTPASGLDGAAHRALNTMSCVPLASATQSPSAVGASSTTV